jgi:hypothetical protein
MALFPSPFDTLLGLQRALDALRTSGWLDAGPSGSGAYPPINVFPDYTPSSAAAVTVCSMKI